MVENTERNLIDNALSHAKILPFYHQECGDNMFIAGGACTRVYYECESLGDSDIDIYCAKQYREFLSEQLHDAGFVLSRYNDNVSTFTDALNKVTFQCIQFPEHFELNGDNSNCNVQLSEFDLSACKLIYMYGKLIPGDEDVKNTLEQKKLRVYSTSTKTFGRMIKYMGRYQLSLDLEHGITMQAHMLMRSHLLETFPPEMKDYGI